MLGVLCAGLDLAGAPCVRTYGIHAQQQYRQHHTRRRKSRRTQGPSRRWATRYEHMLTIC